MSIVAVVLVPLADKVPDPADVKPGWLGFGMFLALAAATVLLWLSFRRQLKKVRFDVEPLPPRRNGRARPPATPPNGSAGGVIGGSTDVTAPSAGPERSGAGSDPSED